MFLWGVIGVFFVPWDPFGIPNAAQIVVCVPLFVYLVHTWERPRLRLAQCVVALMIGYTSLRLPWATVVWCQMGRPLEVFTVPQLAAVAIGLVWPGRWSHGMVVIWLFCGQALFGFFYARGVGLDELVPMTEPFGTFAFTLLGFGLLFLRQHSRELAQQHVRARAELQALERLRPLFAHAEAVLDAQVDVLASAVSSLGERKVTRNKVIPRVVDRLGDLRHTLGGLVSSEEAAPPLQEAERRLLDRDAQLGAMLLAMLGVALSVPAVLTFRAEVGAMTVPLMTALFVFYGVMLSYLVATRRRPSARRASWVTIALFATTLPVIAYNQYWLLEEGRPYAPFLGHKLLMGIVGLSLASRFKLGATLIIITAASAIATWFALDLGAHTDIVETAEPFATMIYMVVGLTSLRRLERSQVASIQLLRDEAEAAAIQRRALMFLALRDQLNSPLQTLVLGAGGAIAKLPGSSGERVQAAIDRLVGLSRELAEIDVPEVRRAISTSLDAGEVLRRRV